MKLLDFYKARMKIDPEVDCMNLIKKYDDLYKKFRGLPNEVGKLSDIYYNSSANLYTYSGPVLEYFASVSGIKAIIGDEYFGLIDYYFPYESPLFDLEYSPIMCGWLIEDIKTKNHLTRIETLLDYPDPSSIVKLSFSNLADAIREQDYWGFWMGDLRNYKRKTPIKLRHFRVKNGSPITIYPLLSITLKDQNDGKELKIEDIGSGWRFYLSKELLEEKLGDLEILWTRGYDDRVRRLDGLIKEKQKELDNLILDRKTYMNGLSEYKEKLKNILWKDFSTL